MMATPLSLLLHCLLSPGFMQNSSFLLRQKIRKSLGTLMDSHSSSRALSKLLQLSLALKRHQGKPLRAASSSFRVVYNVLPNVCRKGRDSSGHSKAYCRDLSPTHLSQYRNPFLSHSSSNHWAALPSVSRPPSPGLSPHACGSASPTTY